MGTVYTAGPMRGYPQFNFPAFDRASALGRSLGWTVISPAEMDRDAGIDEKENDSPVFPEETIRVFMRRDAKVFTDVLKAERGDAIALLPNWLKSTGARAEVALAIWAKLLILDATTFLPLNVELVGVEHRPAKPAAFQSCGIEGGCGADEDLGRHATILIAQDFADRETV